MTFVLPGGLGIESVTGSSGWDPTMFGWGAPGPGLLSAPAPGTLGGPSVAPLLAPTSITETFGTVENPLSHGGQWLHQTVYWANMAVGSFNLPPVTNVCYGLQTGANVYGDAYSYLSPLVWPPSHTDYTVAATINRNNAVLGPGGETDEFECVLRVADSAAPTGTGTVTLYEVNYQIDGAYAQFVAWNGRPGSFTILYPGPGTQPALVTGDVIAVTVQGLTFTLKRNGTTLFTQTDPATGGGDPNYTGPFNFGQPGIAKFYQFNDTGGAGPGNHFGFTQVVVTSAPFTAPVPALTSVTVPTTATAGTIVGQIPCQHNPTSWTFVGAPPPGLPAGALAIDSFANVVVQAAAVGAMTPGSYALTAQATNSFGSNTARVNVTVTGLTGPIFSNSNHTVIDGDDTHGRALCVRAKRSLGTTGTTASLRRYVEFQVGISPELPQGQGFVSVGLVLPAWNPVTVSTSVLGEEIAATSVGLVVPASSGASEYFLIYGGGNLLLGGAVNGGDVVGMAVDNSGAVIANTLIWFNVNGIWQCGAGSSTFPGVGSRDLTIGLTQCWPACSTSSSVHMTINPSPRQLHTPPGFQPWG